MAAIWYEHDFNKAERNRRLQFGWPPTKTRTRTGTGMRTERKWPHHCDKHKFAAPRPKGTRAIPIAPFVGSILKWPELTDRRKATRASPERTCAINQVVHLRFLFHNSGAIPEPNTRAQCLQNTNTLTHSHAVHSLLTYAAQQLARETRRSRLLVVGRRGRLQK